MVSDTLSRKGQTRGVGVDLETVSDMEYRNDSIAMSCDMGPASWGWRSLRAQILKKIKILKFSSELGIFKRATHQTPIFCGEFWSVSIDKISSEIEIFKRD